MHTMRALVGQYYHGCQRFFRASGDNGGHARTGGMQGRDAVKMGGAKSRPMIGQYPCFLTLRFFKMLDDNF